MAGYPCRQQIKRCMRWALPKGRTCRHREHVICATEATILPCKQQDILQWLYCIGSVTHRFYAVLNPVQDDICSPTGIKLWYRLWLCARHT